MVTLRCKMCGGEIEMSADKINGTCKSCGSAAACSEARSAQIELEKSAEIQKAYQQRKNVAEKTSAEREIDEKRAEIQLLVEQRENLEEKKLQLKWDYEKKLVDLNAAIPNAECALKKTKKRRKLIVTTVAIGVAVAIIALIVAAVLVPDLGESLMYLLFILAQGVGERAETVLAGLVGVKVVKTIKPKGVKL